MDTYSTPDKEEQARFYAQIGDTITLARKRIGITQDDLAWILGLSRVSLVNIESGKQRSPLHFIISLCNILDIKMVDLIPEYKGNVKTIDDLKRHKAINSFSKMCSHEAMEHITSTTGKEYYICPICNFSRQI